MALTHHRTRVASKRRPGRLTRRTQLGGQSARRILARAVWTGRLPSRRPPVLLTRRVSRSRQRRAMRLPMAIRRHLLRSIHPNHQVPQALTMAAVRRPIPVRHRANMRLRTRPATGRRPSTGAATRVLAMMWDTGPTATMPIGRVQMNTADDRMNLRIRPRPNSAAPSVPRRTAARLGSSHRHQVTAMGCVTSRLERRRALWAVSVRPWHHTLLGQRTVRPIVMLRPAGHPHRRAPHAIPTPKPRTPAHRKAHGHNNPPLPARNQQQLRQHR